MMFEGINVVSIAVPDLAAARRFYGEVLGLGVPLYDLPEDGWIEFGTGGAGGNLSLVPAPPRWKPSENVTVVLNVADCEAAVAALRARGVRCEEAQVFPGYVVYASFFDPFGNRIQMCSAAD